MNEQTLELQIQSSAEQAVAGLEKLKSELTGISGTITKVSTQTDKSGQTILKSLTTTVTKGKEVHRIIQSFDKDGNIKKVSNSMSYLKDKTEGTAKSMDKLGTALSLGAVYLGLKRIATTIASFMDDAVNFTEQLNLFNVTFKNIEKDGVTAFSNIGKEATKFQYKLNEAFGTNKTETLYMQGMFQAMGEAAGISDKHASLMSETMTKLSYDLASLYNKEESKVAEAIRAGVYAGQTKPMRSFGIDVTQTSTEPILAELGINRTMKSLNNAEKEILRYIAVLKQSQNAMGDFANTIESPANQLKVFRQQLAECRVAIANLFMGLYSTILPYANAFIMVVKEIAKTIASLFGIKVKDYNSGIASYSKDLEDVETGAGKASKAVAKLKRQVLGFDEVHNINEDTGTGGGSGGGVASVGGIDQRLLDALKGYDNGMDQVRMKAAEIRDKWMEILGFQKQIDPITGEISWKYLGLATTISNLWREFKKLPPVGKLLMGLGLIGFGTNLYKIGKKLYNLLGGSGITKVLKTLLTPAKNLVKSFFVNGAGEATKLGTALGSLKTTLGTIFTKIGTVGLGVSGLVISLTGMSASAKDAAENGLTFGNSLGAIVSELGAMGSGALIGSAFGPMGTIVGAASGALIGLLTGLTEYSKRVQDLAKLKDFFDGQGTSIEVIGDKIKGVFDNCVNTEAIGNVSALAEEWKNAKVSVDNARDGVDKLVDSFALQIQMGDQITKNQLTEMTKSYDMLAEETKNAQKTSDEFYLSLLQNHLNEIGASKEESAQQIANLKAVQSARNKYSTEYIAQEKELTLQWGRGKISSDEYFQKVHDLQVKYGMIAETAVDTTAVVGNFSDVLEKIDYGDPKKAVETVENVRTKYTETKDVLNTYKDLLKSTGKEQEEEVKKTLKNLEETKKVQGTLTEFQQQMYDTLKEYQNGNKDIIKTAVSDIEANITEIEGNYKGFLLRVYTDLKKSGVDTTDEFKDIVKTINTDLNTLKKVDVTGFGKTLVDSAIKDVDKWNPTLVQNIARVFGNAGYDGGEEFRKKLSEKFSSPVFKNTIYKDLTSTGQYGMEGFVFGVDDYLAKYGAGGDKIGKSILNETEKSLLIKSPSRKMAELGNYAVEGFAQGINQGSVNVLKEIDLLLSKISAKFKTVSFSIGISTSVESSFNTILTKLDSFTSKFRSGINSLLSGMKTSMNSIKVDGNGKIAYTSMPKITIPKFESGGIPDKGTLFWAGENGAEIVGQAHGRTEVLNQSQIANAIYSAVSNAMSQYSGGTTQIELVAHTDEGVVIDRINQKTKQTGVFPLNIPIA